MIRKVLLGLALLCVVPAPLTAMAADTKTVEHLLNATDDVARGESSIGVMTMHVKTDRYERTVVMKAWSKGTENSLVVIQSPEKEKGVATLKVGDNIWNYLPKVDRTVKVPANMMSGAWMGSHITNDDLVKENRLSEDFTYVVSEEPKNGQGKWVIELTPKADAAVVWGKIVVEVTADELPHEIRYYDEAGALVRTMSFNEIKEMGGRKMPTVMRVTPADKPGEYTEIVYNELQFGVDIPDSTFTLQSLRQ